MFKDFIKAFDSLQKIKHFYKLNIKLKGLAMLNFSMSQNISSYSFYHLMSFLVCFHQYFFFPRNNSKHYGILIEKVVFH